MAALPLALVLLAAPPPSDFHPGLGYMMQHAQPVTPGQPTSPEAEQSEPARKEFAYIPRPQRPPTNYDVAKNSQQLRAVQVGVALAAEAAMIIYGVMSVREQAAEARSRRQEELEPYNFNRRY